MTSYFGMEIPFLEYLGAVPEFAANGRSRLSLELRRELSNSVGVAQGGLVMTLLDVAMAAAAWSVTNPQVGMATITQTTHFLRPSTGKLTVDGLLIKEGKSVYYCEATVIDSSGRITAKSSGTFSPRKTA